MVNTVLSIDQITSLLGLDTKCVSNLELNQQILGITANSQEVKPGWLFVAVRGGKSNGHDFIDQAFQLGALAAIVDNQECLADYPGIVLKDTRLAWAKLSEIYFANPSEKIKIFGVTGTNGKTTVQWLLSQALQLLGYKVVRIGTLGIYLDETFIADSLTTPDAWNISQALYEGIEKGASSAVLEVSSHALSQSRVAALEFDVCIYTNLSRDHLDYHTSFDSYFESKRKLFSLLALGKKSSRLAVINIDDSYGQKLLDICQELSLATISYGYSEKADLRLASLALSMSGSELSIQIKSGELFSFTSGCIGKHNAYNLLAVWGALSSLGMSDLKISELLPELEAAPGRLEAVGDESLAVFVDYAHTPDALENVLLALRPLASKNKLWVVFGCGGDRDKGKRPLMGDIAMRLADKVVVTSDNPRTEDPKHIIDDIVNSSCQPEFVDVDRRKAIEVTLEKADKGDIVLIAGKGHEDYQVIGNKKYHFSDQEIVREYLSRKSNVN